MARRQARRRVGRGTLIVAALLIALLVGWGVARWRSSSLVLRAAPPEAEHGDHPTEEDRAALERVIRERAE